MYQSDHDNSDLEAFKIALIQLRAGDIEYAIDTLQELTCKSPENSIYWYTLGTAYGKAQRYDESFKAYKKSQNTKKCSSIALKKLATAFIKMEDTDNAILVLKQLSQIRPDLVPKIKI